jgi:hypothetical protein
METKEKTRGQKPKTDRNVRPAAKLTRAGMVAKTGVKAGALDQGFTSRY